MDDIRLVDNAYERGQLSMFEWFDFKDRYSLPEKQTDKYLRTCLYPTFGARAYHLGKVELLYALKAVQNGWTKTISSFRRSIELREKAERFDKIKEKMRERFMAW